MKDFLKNSSNKATEIAANFLSPHNIESITKIAYRFSFEKDHTFHNTLFLMQGNGFYGKVHSDTKKCKNLQKYVGCSLVDLLNDENHLIRLLALDSIFYFQNKKHNKSFYVESDNIIIKHNKFRSILNKCLTIEQDDKVLILGADPIIPYLVYEKTKNIIVTDLSKERIGRHYKIGNSILPIKNAKYNSDYFKKCNLAIVTGMSFSSNTINRIIEFKNETRLIFYLVSCANLARELISTGAEMVISVNFPTLDMPGKTRIDLYNSN